MIVCVLGLQFAAVVVRPKEQGWPFTNYPMFAAARHEGDRVMVAYNVFASLGNGREIKLAAEDIDIPNWLFRKWAAHLVRQAKQPRSPVPQSARIRARLRDWLRPPQRDWDAISAAILARYQKLTEAPITALRIEDTPVIVTRAGMADAAPQVLTTVVVDSDEVIQGTLSSHHLEGSR